MKLRIRPTCLAACVLALGILVGSGNASAQTLANYRFTSAGWATFGIALPQGKATGGLRIGNLPTQTDVKRTWPDGSIRHAIVTAQIPAAGTLAITGAAASTGRFTPKWPQAAVSFNVGGTVYAAILPPFNGADAWLSAGGLVREARVHVVPVARGIQHPFLRVVFDVRSYSDGTHRLDVAVNNTLNVAATNAVTYDVTISIDGATRFARAAITHGSFKRWRQTFWTTAGSETSYLPDLNPFFDSRAFTRFVSTISQSGMPYATSGSRYDVLQPGLLTPNMEQTGGRPELGVRPDWVAQFTVFKTANLFDAVRYYGGNPSGFFGTHVTESDDASLISLDAKPEFWFDPSRRYAAADGVHGPANNMAGLADYGDTAHYPSLAFAPYILTGDRWYLDELKFVVNYHLLRAHWNRQGSAALYIEDNQIRGMAWATRDLADFAAWAPDAEPWRGYFAKKLLGNLSALDQHASASLDPLGSVDWMLPASNTPNDLPMWQVAYLCWALDHAQRQGFNTAGTAVLTKWLVYQNNLFSTTSGWNRTNGVPYYIFARSNSDGRYFRTFSDMWTYNYVSPYTANTNPGGGPQDIALTYSAEGLLAMRIAAQRGIAGAAANLGWLQSYSSGDQSVVASANLYPRFGVDQRSVGVGDLPAAPQNVRINQNVGIK